MKYTTLMLGFAILMASAGAGATNTPIRCDLCKSLQHIPVQYRGTWCFIHEGTKARIYQRCQHKNKHGMEVTAAFPIIDGMEGRNKITYVGTYPSGAPGLLLQGVYVAIDRQDDPIEWRWSLSRDGQYLLWED